MGLLEKADAFSFTHAAAYRLADIDLVEGDRYMILANNGGSMKVASFLVALLLSTTAFGSGKFIIQPMQNAHTKQNLSPQIGFSVYEKLPLLAAAYNGYIGSGEPLVQKTDADDVRWFTTKHSVELYIGKVTVAPGFQIVWNGDEGWSKKEDFAFLKLAYQVW